MADIDSLSERLRRERTTRRKHLADDIADVGGLVITRGSPGRPKKSLPRPPHHVTRTGLDRLSLMKRRERTDDPTITSTTYYNWTDPDDPITPLPEKHADFLLEMGQTGMQAVPHLTAYAPVWIDKQAERVSRAAQRVLDAEPGEKVSFEIETTTRIRAVVRNTERSSAAADLAEVRRVMAAGTRFGWVTDAPTLMILDISVPCARLFDIPTEKLNGSYMIEDPLQSALERRLANYGEYLIGLGFWLQPYRAHWEKTSQTNQLKRAANFFALMRHYLDNYSNYCATRIQIRRSARRRRVFFDLSDWEADKVLDEVMLAAHARADRDIPWPNDTFGYSKSIPMYLRTHDLLPVGQTARFDAAARRIPPLPHEPMGLEVTIDGEFADPAANALMRAILDDLGYLEDD